MLFTEKGSIQTGIWQLKNNRWFRFGEPKELKVGNSKLVYNQIFFVLYLFCDWTALLDHPL
jgi:hypothetical protein